jgi:hypothetical protein
MKRYGIFICLLLIVIPFHQQAAADVERSQTIKKALPFAGEGDKLVIVDNVFGSIKVEGYGGDEVRMTARKTIIARSDKYAKRAEERVTLEIYEQDDYIEFYVDGPFRDKRKHGIDWRGYKKEQYKVIYDFKLQVPMDCAVELQTVNEGDITVESLKGDFDVSNVNGGIEMKGLRGTGNVYTVNGEVEVAFDKNPGEDCSFGTINGDVKLYFQPSLSADFYLKTMNGEAFTDFEVSSLPVRTKKSRADKGRKIYKLGHSSGIRAGNGGPEIEMNTLNGDMFILSK